MPTKRILQRVLTATSWLVIAGAAAIGLARYAEPTSVSTVGVTAISPWSLLPAAAAVAGLAALRGWRPALLGGLVVALIGWPQVANYLPAQHFGAAPIITVMTANTLHGTADPGALVASVRAHEVDVLAAQELTLDSIRRLTEAGLDQALPYHVIAYQDGGTDVGIWSRHPLIEPQQLTGFAFAPVQASIVVGPGQLTVVAFHCKAPVSNDGVELWQSDLDRLAKVMTHPATRTIVAGDFNATRDHRQFRDLLDTGYTDAGSDAGAGMLPTYPADRRWGPIIGIDHVLVSAGLVGVGGDRRRPARVRPPRSCRTGRTGRTGRTEELTGGYSGMISECVSRRCVSPRKKAGHSHLPDAHEHQPDPDHPETEHQHGPDPDDAGPGTVRTRAVPDGPEEDQPESWR